MFVMIYVREFAMFACSQCSRVTNVRVFALYVLVFTSLTTGSTVSVSRGKKVYKCEMGTSIEYHIAEIEIFSSL